MADGRSSVESSGFDDGGARLLPDIPYRENPESAYAAERCKLDLYLPAATARDFPTILWFHGGALTFGDKAMGTVPQLARSLNRQGVAVASVNYRLLPTAEFPACADDAAAAFAWVHRNIAGHGGDVNRVIVAGHSAGGYLAALIGFDPQYLAAHGLATRDVAGLFLVSPQVFTHFTVRGARGVPSPFTTPAIDDAAPCFHARTDAPPLLITLGDHDLATRLEENQYFVATLDNLRHHDVELRVIADRDHASVVDRMADEADPGRLLLDTFVERVGNPLALVSRAHRFATRTAVVAQEGRFTYGQLLSLSANAAGVLLGDQPDLAEQRVAFLTPPGMAYVVTQWAVWRAGGIAVPLCTQHPAPELAYILDDAQASVVVAHADYAPLLRPLAEARGLRFLTTDELMTAPPPATRLPRVTPERRAMLVYTSGTTSKPKGVVVTHAMLAAQIASLVRAWEWTPDDHILHVLPLHHVHGILNVLCCALWSGATCEIMPKFDAGAVWGRLSAGDGPTLFMAVPTIYARLLAAWEAADPTARRAMTEGCRRLRLMVSGSAALPVSTLEKWREATGHTLLERFGMTEIGMALSNPLHGTRKPGTVGTPLPGVDVRLVDDANRSVADGEPGQIQVRGPTVFGEYWRRPDATRQAFTPDGWFKTGDVAVRHCNVYRILGRDSVDIIKSGGYKISALEIEEVLRTHDAVDECAVVGLDDAEWGQRVGAAVVLKANESMDLDGLRAWAKERLAVYKVPTRLALVDELPRNPLGKVVKPDVAKLFAAEAAPA